MKIRVITIASFILPVCFSFTVDSNTPKTDPSAAALGSSMEEPQHDYRDFEPPKEWVRCVMRDSPYEQHEDIYLIVKRWYRRLDRDELGITPEERLLRVAAYILHAENDWDKWATNWAVMNGKGWQDPAEIRKDFYEFAYQARFGRRPRLWVRAEIKRFDTAYRKFNAIPLEN